MGKDHVKMYFDEEGDTKHEDGEIFSEEGEILVPQVKTSYTMLNNMQNKSIEVSRTNNKAGVKKVQTIISTPEK